jgi:hypothetical protein
MMQGHTGPRAEHIQSFTRSLAVVGAAGIQRAARLRAASPLQIAAYRPDRMVAIRDRYLQRFRIAFLRAWGNI